MAGSWERINNDKGEYQQYIKETTGPLLYALDPNRFYNCQECRPDQPGKIGSGVSVSKKWPLVDVESDLKNITRPLTNDPLAQYGGAKCKKNGNLQNQPVVTAADPQRNFPSCNILTDETRLTNPAGNLRGTGVSQHIFRQLNDNVQDWGKLAYPGTLRENSKLMAKDNYVNYAAPPVANAAAGLPNAKAAVPTPLGYINVPAVFTDPLNTMYSTDINESAAQKNHIQPALDANYKHIMDYYNKL